MLAAYHVAPNRLEVRETPLPVLEPNEALTRVKACAFCGSDKHDLARAPDAPRVPGHEFSGIVEGLAGGDVPRGRRRHLRGPHHALRAL